jgi:hypothetical protein
LNLNMLTRKLVLTFQPGYLINDKSFKIWQPISSNTVTTIYDPFQFWSLVSPLMGTIPPKEVAAGRA